MSERTLDPERLSKWVGRSENADDLIDTQHARLMQATLDETPTLRDGDALPGLWNWLYFPSEVPMHGLGRDGHPKLGGFLPPVALPRRMWAGGRFRLMQPLRLGAIATRRSKILSVRPKQGRSGALCFVTVGHDYSQGALCFSEEHDIVYREDPTPGAPAPKPPAASSKRDFEETITPSPVLLFRYSALTFNGHRIHYDRDYCRDVEGYGGLVVHGPLIATMLFALARSQCGDAFVASYAYRAISPLIDTEPFKIAGVRSDDGLSLWAENLCGELAMTAEARFQQG